MAKVAQVIGGIALVALAIAGSVFIPGVGGYVLSATMQSIAFGIGSTLALRGVTSLVQRPASVKAAATTQRGVTSQDPVGPRRINYGAVKLGGIVTFKSFTGAGYGGTGDNTIYMVVTMSGKRVHAITNLYLNGNYVHLDGGGDADDLYAGLVHAEYNLGTDTQSAFPGLVADSNGLWTAFHKQLRCAGAYLRIDIDKPPFSGSVPNATFDLDGCRVYDPREDVSRGGAQTFDDPETWVWTRNAVLIIADFLRDPTGYNAEYADILESLLIAGANLSDERVSLAGLTGFSGVGLDDLVGGGTYSGAVDPQVFNFKLSTEGTPDKFQWQEGDGDWSAEIDITGGFQTIADGVTAKFTATTGHTAGDMWTLRVGTEARYCIDGTYDTTEDPSSVLTDMAAAIAGTVYQVGGQWLIVPGAFRTPYPVPFTPDDFTEAFKVTITRSRKDLFNSVKGTFIPDHSAIQTDFPAYKGSKYITQDGESIYKDVSMRFVKSSSACMRIGKISVERNRRQKLISTSTKLLGYETQPGDVRNLLFDRYAWVAASSGSITLDVNAAAGTFTRPSGSFITDGFIVNQPVIITGMAKDGNNTIGVIKTVTALVITLKDNTGLEDETGAGSQGIDGKNTFEVIGVQFGIKDDNGKPVHTVAVTLAETDEHAYSWMGKEEIVPAINPDANVDLVDVKDATDLELVPDQSGILAVGATVDPSVDYTGMDIFFIVDDITQRQGAHCLLGTAMLIGDVTADLIDCVDLVVGSVLTFDKEIMTITGPGALGDVIPATATVDVARAQALSAAAGHLINTLGFQVTGTNTYTYIFPSDYVASVPVIAGSKQLFAILRPGALRIIYCRVKMRLGDHISPGFDKSFEIDPGSPNAEPNISGALPGVRTYEGGEFTIKIDGPMEIGDDIAPDLAFPDGKCLGVTTGHIEQAPLGTDIQFEIDTVYPDDSVLAGGITGFAAGTQDTGNIYSGTAGGNMNGLRFRFNSLQVGSTNPGVSVTIHFPY